MTCETAIYAHLQRLENFDFHDDAETGQLMSRMTVDRRIRSLLPVRLRARHHGDAHLPARSSSFCGAVGRDAGNVGAALWLLAA
jgi:hypothetical protein